VTSPALNVARRSHVIVAEGKPAPISDQLAGRKIARLLSTADCLLIRCTDGTEVRIGWRDDSGRRQGRPYLEDVRRWT